MFKEGLIRSASAAAVLGLALTMSAPAVAQIEPGLDLATVEQLVQNGATTDLHIHKHETPQGEAGNGLPQQVESPTLAGAQFTIERVEGVDLTTQAGWQQAQDIQQGTAAGEALDFTEVGVYTTDANGVARDSAGNVPNLVVGLYRVTETMSPAGYTVAGEPFYVALPMTHPVSLNTRLTEVHVYPKNTPVVKPTAVKTVVDANTGAGDVGTDGEKNVLYHITVTVPQAETNYDQFVIDDYHETDRLAPVGTGVTGVTGTNADGEEVTFEQGVDYTVTNLGVVPETDWSHIAIEFTEQGLDRINGEGITEVVASFEFDARALTGDPEDPVDPARGTYGIRSSQELEPDEEPETPGTNPETVTYYGNVLLTKYGPGENNPLAGAEFVLYRCNSITDMEATPIRTGITTRADDPDTTADETGTVWIRGLHVNDYVDNVAQTSDPSGYCLIEAKSPEGFELQAQPIYFQVLRNAEEQTVEPHGVDVRDVQANAGFQLPLTGGNGVWFLLGAGGLLILVGGIYETRQRRSEA